MTVLAACLGLLIIGVPAQVNARQTAMEVAHYGTSSIRLSLVASTVSSLQVLKVDDRWLPDVGTRVNNQPERVLYQGPKAPVENNQVLIVTRLPRAALSDLPANPPTAN
jgi:hypothetical protein